MSRVFDEKNQKVLASEKFGNLEFGVGAVIESSPAQKIQRASMNRTTVPKCPTYSWSRRATAPEDSRASYCFVTLRSILERRSKVEGAAL
jgi:hypothetical protein